MELVNFLETQKPLSMICAKGKILLQSRTKIIWGSHQGGQEMQKLAFSGLPKIDLNIKTFRLSKSRSKSDNTLMNLYEDDQHPKPAIP